MQTVVCMLCGQDNARPVISSVDRRSDNPQIFQLVECQACGLVYLNPRPTPEEIGAYYLDTYGPHQQVESWRPSRQGLVRREIIYSVASLHYNTPPFGTSSRLLVDSGLTRPIIKLITLPLRPRLGPLPQYKAPGRLLEVGCGVGAYLDLVRDLGWETYGVEISAKAAMLSQQKGHQVVHGTLDSANWPDHYFQAACLWHTLEHFHNPLAELRELCRVLTPGAELLVESPNFEGVGRSVFDVDWFALDLPRHLYFFTTHTMHRILQEAGFEPTGMRTAPSRLATVRSQAHRRESQAKANLRPARSERLERWWLMFVTRLLKRGDLLWACARRL